MDLILAILQAYKMTKEVARVSGGVSDWVFKKLTDWAARTAAETVADKVDALEGVTDSQIETAAAQVFRDSAVTQESQREIVYALSTAAHNVQHRNLYGPFSGTASGSKGLIEGLFQKRHEGEPVTDGSPWLLRRYLGKGSFGEVWMAQNPDYPKLRAYKFFVKDDSGEWLRREQKNLVAVLNLIGGHPHVMEFKDVQTENCRFPYLAFEYLGGGSLADCFKNPSKGLPLPVHEIVRQVVAGLAAAHAQGITHRDIKPANILLTEGPDVRVKIGDFGLSRVAGPKRDGQSQLGTLGGLVGTPFYLPPESFQRIAREPAQDDVFALGVVWYQLLVGAIERPPYDFTERLRSKDVDSHTVDLICRCLARPERRFADAGAVQAALTDVVPPPKPCPPGEPDVQHLAREYLAVMAR